MFGLDLIFNTLFLWLKSADQSSLSAFNYLLDDFLGLGDNLGRSLGDLGSLLRGSGLLRGSFLSLFATEKDVVQLGSWLLGERSSNKLFGRLDAVGTGGASTSESSLDEFTGALVNILDRHELLMPDDLLSAVGSLDTEDAADILKNAKTERNIFPEEARVGIQHDAVGHLRVLGNHGEHNATVTNVSVEDALETALIADLTVVHGADALRDGHNLRELQVWETLHQSLLDSLNLVIKELDFLGTFRGEVLVKERHLAGLKGGLSVPVLEVGIDATGVNDLVRWSQREVEEAWNRNGWDSVGQ